MLTLHSLKVRCLPDQHVLFESAGNCSKLCQKISFICLNMGCAVYLQSALVRWFETMWWPQNWFSVIHYFPKCSGCNGKLWCLISTRDNFRTTASLICITSSYTFMTNRPKWDFLSLLFFFFLHFPKSGPSWTFTAMAEIPPFLWQPQ